MEKYIYILIAFIVLIAILWLVTELIYARLRRRSGTGKRAFICYPKTNDLN